MGKERHFAIFRCYRRQLRWSLNLWTCGFIAPKPVERYYYKLIRWCLQRWWSCRCAQVFWPWNGQIKKKNYIAFFKQHGLQITIEINLKVTDFLNNYLDLENNKFYSYRKPNDTPFYVHRKSNYYLNILKQLPRMTSKRLLNLSCNEDEFIKASDEYQNVSKNSGFKDKLVYTPSNQRNRRQSNRKIICYNPPFDLQVKTNMAKLFYNYWTEISHPFIDYIRLSIGTPEN